MAPGLRLIIGWKAGKGAVELLCGLLVLGAVLIGRAPEIQELATTLRHHVTARLAIEVADGLLKLSDPPHLTITGTGIALDGIVGLVEAFLLYRGRLWALWIVVVASALLIPWEVVEMVHRWSWSRLALLIANVGVVIYLALQARHHSRALKPAA